MCVYICMYIYIYICMYVYIYIYIRMYMVAPPQRPPLRLPQAHEPCDRVSEASLEKYYVVTIISNILEYYY